jgi:CheY-like chemotaxis protein
MNRLINILLVEDDYLDQMEVQRTLQKKNILYRIKIAKNGEEGIQLLKDNQSDIFTGKPDIVLLDLNMPKMNGLEFLNIIKKNDEWKDIKVFILTTSEENEEKNAAIKLGASGYIIKPLQLSSPSSIDAFNLMIDLMNMQG